MPSDQRIIGEAVVELCRSKRDQSMPAPMMLAVARLALLRPGVGFAMKPRRPADVASDPLVACQAFPVLCLALERGMAAVALFLDFCVSRAQRTGADELFPSTLGTGVRRQQQQGDKRKYQPPEMH